MSEAAPESAQTKQPPSWKQDLSQIKKVGLWVALLVSIPALGIPGILAKLLKLEEILALWQVIVLTAPLTAAIAVVGVVVLRPPKEDYWAVIWLLPCLTLFLTTLLSRFLGFGLAIDPSATFFRESGGPTKWFFRMVAAYYALYGFWSFASSILVGGFLAWVWAEKVLPRLESQEARSDQPDELKQPMASGAEPQLSVRWGRLTISFLVTAVAGVIGVIVAEVCFGTGSKFVVWALDNRKADWVGGISLWIGIALAGVLTLGALVRLILITGHAWTKKRGRST